MPVPLGTRRISISPLPLAWFSQSSVELAQALLGCTLVHESSSGRTAGIIVETEAYHQNDPASHSFGGPSRRNSVMFGPAGHAYIYLSYGIHYCFNVVAGHDNTAEAVLIRALEPTEGVALMQQRRGTEVLTNLCSGPAKLVQAMGIEPAQNGIALDGQIQVLPRTQVPKIAISPRIGITKAADKPWRFFIPDNPHVTKHKFNLSSVS